MRVERPGVRRIREGHVRPALADDPRADLVRVIEALRVAAEAYPTLIGGAGQAPAADVAPEADAAETVTEAEAPAAAPPAAARLHPVAANRVVNRAANRAGDRSADRQAGRRAGRRGQPGSSSSSLSIYFTAITPSQSVV